MCFVTEIKKDIEDAKVLEMFKPFQRVFVNNRNEKAKQFVTRYSLISRDYNKHTHFNRHTHFNTFSSVRIVRDVIFS